MYILTLGVHVDTLWLLLLEFSIAEYIRSNYFVLLLAVTSMHEHRQTQRKIRLSIIQLIIYNFESREIK